MKSMKISLIIILLVILLFRNPYFVLADSVSLEGVLPCSYESPSAVAHYLSHLTDDNPFTTVTLERNETIELSLSKPSLMRGLFFNFYESPESLNVTFLDQEHVPFQTERIKDPGYILKYPVPEKPASYIQVSCLSGKVVFSELYPFTDDFQFPFPDLPEQADVLIILDKPGDELELFGGLLADLSKEHQISIQLMYLTATDGYKVHQCLSVLEAMGIRIMPLWGMGKTPSSLQTEKAIFTALGGESVVKRNLVSTICAVKPKIVLTLSNETPSDRYADAIIHDLVVSSVSDAADPKRYPDLTSHVVSKLYALSQEGSTIINLDLPLISLGGIDSVSYAKQLYDYYLEDRVYQRKVPSTLRFDLLYSTVGEDTVRNSLLENLNTADFSTYIIPSPIPTSTPDPTQIPSPSVNPTSVPTLSNEKNAIASPVATMIPLPASQESTETAHQNHAPLAFWLSFFLSIIGLLCLVFFIPIFKPIYKQKWLFIPILLNILIIAYLVIHAGNDQDAVTRADNTPPSISANITVSSSPALSIATDTPVPTPAITATPIPTETPTPEPTTKPSYFLTSDGEEYQLDFDGGHWWYKNQSLYIDISRIESTYPKNNGPLVYYVAHIHMADGSSYRSGVRRYTQPWKFARYEKAVLAITGDNMISAEQTLKGCIIRKGIAYSNYERAATLIIEPDNMTLSVARPKTFSTRELLDRGVRDTYSFGPILVENGEMCSDISKSRVRYPNPRCGIGMIEPGHWVAIVTDGRQKHHSMSINLQYFAELFIEQGCILAYNLDGGSSTGMVFMGEALNQHSSGANSDGQRPWTDALMFGYSDSIPSPDQPTKYTGYHY